MNEHALASLYLKLNHQKNRLHSVTRCLKEAPNLPLEPIRTKH